MASINNQIVLKGCQCQLIVEPHKIIAPAIIHVNGPNPLLNVAFALSQLGFSKEMLWEIGFEIENQNLHPNYSESTHHYIGPYFRWEVSGFWPTVEEEISFGPIGNNMEYRNLIASVLEINHLFQRNPTTLSGGETAKVILASHLLHRPRFLVLDRIFNELDEKSRSSLLDNLKSMLPYSLVFIVDEVLPRYSDFEVSIESNTPEWKKEPFGDGSKKSQHSNSSSELQVDLVSHFTQKSNSTISLHNYSVVRSNKQIFKPINCNACSGDFVLLTGPNGSGKTSFIEGLAGLLKVKGAVTVNRREDNQSKTLFALSPQDPQCDITENNLYEELLFACNNADEVGLFIDHLSLPKYYLKTPLKEDIGLQKLTSILSATLRGKIYCLLDEPSLYLSSEFRIIAKNAILRYLRQGGVVFCSSHDMQFVNYFKNHTTNNTEQWGKD